MAINGHVKVMSAFDGFFLAKIFIVIDNFFYDGLIVGNSIVKESFMKIEMYRWLDISIVFRCNLVKVTDLWKMIKKYPSNPTMGDANQWLHPKSV